MQQLHLDTDAITTLLASELTSIPKDDRHQMDQVAELIVNITNCIELDWFIPFQSEREMEREAQRLHIDGCLFAGELYSTYFRQMSNIWIDGSADAARSITPGNEVDIIPSLLRLLELFLELLDCFNPI